MVNIDIGIDLGTSNTVIYIKDKGIVVNQPSVVAYEAKSKKIIAVGNKAKKMLGKTPEDIEVTRPIRNGVISDYIMTERMLKIYVKSAIAKRKIWGKPNICVCVPSGVTDVQRRAACDAVYRTGAKNVYVLEEPFAAAIGAGVDIESAVGAMVVDIGAGTTDIAIVARGGVQHSSSIKIGGDDFDEAIIRYMRKRHNVLLGESSAEQLKKDIGSVYPREQEAAPPELVSDISEHGIILAGGGSKIFGMDKLIMDKIGVPVVNIKNPDQVVATGAGTAHYYIKDGRTLEE